MSNTPLPDLLRATRAHTLALAAPLSDEDAQLQSMPDASPAKWHLAHTTWFFETLVLLPHLPGYRVFDERWPRLFNSYYESLGPRHARPQRGLLSRPSLAEVKAYRAHVDAALADLLPHSAADARTLIELGCHHEQQHQELLLTDILHAFSCNPLLPAYDASAPISAQAIEQDWLKHPGGIVDIGHGGDGFAFDNEGPRHPALIAPFEISNRLVTCGEFADFVDAGGYREPLLWLSDGWATVQAQGWQRPAYWLEDGRVFGLHGVQPLDPQAPVQQLSFYEACAFAEWAGARLPTEFEWEAACGLAGFAQAADQAWQWTRSSYAPYPGFKPAAGAVGEYNGKFMVGQQVLRGGSLATPPGHARPSYRNFFPPAARWQFSGVRLAR
jgi:ergothioneine biosynthesis protein EgtB